MGISLERCRRTKLYRWLRQNHDAIAVGLDKASSARAFWKEVARLATRQGVSKCRKRRAPGFVERAWECARADHAARIPISDDDASGHIYALPVPHKPWFVKVGMTSRSDSGRPKTVAAQLAAGPRRRAVPPTDLGVSLIYAADRKEAEAATHLVLERYRVPGWGREVFCLPLDLAVRVATITARLCDSIDPADRGRYPHAVVEAVLREIPEVSEPIPKEVETRLGEEQQILDERWRLPRWHNRRPPRRDFDEIALDARDLHQRSLRLRAERGRHLRLVCGPDHTERANRTHI